MKRKFLALVFSLGMTMSLASCGTQGPKGDQGIQGEPGKDGVSVKSITKTSSEGNVDTYTITYSDDSTSTFSVTNGLDGAPGIEGIQGQPGEDGRTPEIKIGSNGNWWIDGVDSGISAKGEAGRSVTSIELTSSEGNIDTYTITYSDGTTSTFKVTNGQDGATGEQGIQGEPGKDGHTPTITIGENGNWFVDGKDTNIKAQGPEGPIGPQGPQGEQGPEGKPGQDGEDGRSIVSIKLTSSEGNIDTYTITYSDGTTSTFTITNGQNGATGEQGIQGEPGKDGHTPKIEIGQNDNWWIDGVDTGISAVAKNKDDIYLVRYVLNGGTMPLGKATTENVVWGNTIDLPIPTKKGHIFKGWFTGETANDKQFYNSDAVFKNLTLYAKWEVGTYKLTLDLNGGAYTGSTELIFKYKDNYNLPINIYKSGHIFEGWTLNGEIIPNTGIYDYENITLKAKFTIALEHKIKLNLNGGSYSGEKEIIVRTNEKYLLPREGVTNGDKVFVGWYNGTEKWEDTGIYPLEDDIYLAAKWEDLETYTFTLDFNGGTSDSSRTITKTNRDFYNGIVSLPIPTKDSYEFYGYAFGNYLFTSTSTTLDLTVIRSTVSSQKSLSLTAKYIGLDENHLGDYYRFGSYPQSKVTDTNIIASLKSATDIDGDGYLNLGEDEYKEVVKNDKSIGYFKVEPIVWEVKSDKTLVSSMILDSLNYNYTSGDRTIEGVQVHGNNYKYSTIRAFLNGYDGSEYQVENFINKGFIDLAFTKEEQAKIKETLVDNSATSTGYQQNQYACENTNDKVFLLSYKEVTNQEYGYKNGTDRMRKGTDYAIANGLYRNNNNYSCYWTRSPYSGYSHIAYRVDSHGDVDISGSVSVDDFGVLPALKIK